MRRFDPYITFNRNCREGMSFYKECFGGELEMMVVKDSPMAPNMPAELQDKILHSALKSDDFVIMGSDMHDSQGYIKGNTVSLSIDCKSEEEMGKFFTYLSNEGHITCPISDQFWGGKFAAITDKFGTSWLLNYDKNSK